MTSAETFIRALESAFARSDVLFAHLGKDEWLARPIALRQPFLFYLGHLPAFAWNQVGRGVLGEGDLDPKLDRLFERGIDPASEKEAANATIESWPSLDDVLAYRDAARSAVRERVERVLARRGDVLAEHGRIFHLVIEHELMHHETLMYMLAEHRAEEAPAPDVIPGTHATRARVSERRAVPAGPITLGARFDALEFGWDNEFDEETTFVDAFAIDSLPVTNADYFAFLDEVHDAERERLLPPGWLIEDGRVRVKTVSGTVPFEQAARWPVQVTGLAARRYAAHHGGRLPTEAELHRAAFATPSGEMRAHPWGDEAPDARFGNFGFARFSPVDVGSQPAGASAFGVEELVGNGWEWTCTPFRPHPGFTAYARTYPGYSADFFDDAHDVVFGASWATDPKLLRRSFRNWYRRSYPHAFTSFRVAYDATQRLRVGNRPPTRRSARAGASASANPSHR